MKRVPITLENETTTPVGRVELRVTRPYKSRLLFHSKYKAENPISHGKITAIASRGITAYTYARGNKHVRPKTRLVMGTHATPFRTR